MQESILKTSSPSSKKYAKVHEKAPKIPNLKSQDPNKSKTQKHKTQDPNKIQNSNSKYQKLKSTKSQIPGTKEEQIQKFKIQEPNKNQYSNSNSQNSKAYSYEIKMQRLKVQEEFLLIPWALRLQL